MKNRHVLFVAALSLLPLLNATAAHAGTGDSTVCPILAASAPGEPGVVDISPDGDTTVGGQSVWDCPPYGNPPRASGHVTIHRFPNRGPILLAAPSAGGVAWHCVDVHTGAPVMAGAMLASPNPGVYCTPPAGFSDACTSVQASGYYTAGAGAVIVTSACNGLQASQPLTLGQTGTSGPTFGNGTLPWSCQVQEFLVTPSLTDYWTWCDVNVP